MMKRMKLFAGAGLFGCLVFATTPAIAAEYRWLNSWDKTLPQTYLFVAPLLKGIDEASKGNIKFNVSGPETVPAFEQLQPTQAGAFQFLFTHGAYHFGTNPLLAATEAMTGTPEQRYASGVFDLVDKHYQRIGLKLLSMVMSVDGAYQIILKKPPTAAGDLQGHKIRGNPTYSGVIRMLGASMVTLPPGEIYTALDKGVVDGFAWPSYGVMDTRFYEAAKYILRPGFGYGTNPILVNLTTWNGMS
ncbi:MAG: TRAP transporter substrate-binding protein DctP, partial [Burkholderiales bacterium]